MTSDSKVDSPGESVKKESKDKDGDGGLEAMVWPLEMCSAAEFYGLQESTKRWKCASYNESDCSCREQGKEERLVQTWEWNKGVGAGSWREIVP